MPAIGCGQTSLIELIAGLSGKVIDVERLAITPFQVAEYELTVVEKYDKRTKQRHPAVETEALGQDLLAALVGDRLTTKLRNVQRGERSRNSSPMKEPNGQTS